MGIDEVVPFLAVKDMPTSLAFYRDGLGFEVKDSWVDEGAMRWCRLQLGGAGLMLQQYRTEGHDSHQFSDNKGEGVTLYFFCDDTIELYRAVTSGGIGASDPVVSNGWWMTSVDDPDEYQLAFESDTDVAEDTRLSDIE